MISFKSTNFVLFVAFLTVAKTEFGSDANDSTTSVTDSVTTDETTRECVRKLHLTAQTKSMFNIGSKVYIRYFANKSEYQYIIYDTDTKLVEEITDNSPLFPGSSDRHVLFAAAITDVSWAQSHSFKPFMITIETENISANKRYNTYNSNDGKQWREITNQNDLPKFKLNTTDELRVYSKNGFWPKEVYQLEFVGFGYYSTERIFVIVYHKRSSEFVDIREIKYKKVVTDNAGVHTEDWIVMQKSDNLMEIFGSVFEMSGKFYANFLMTRNEWSNLLASIIAPLEFTKHGNETIYKLSYSIVVRQAIDVIKYFFECDPLKIIQTFTTFEPNRYNPSTESPNKGSNMLIIIGLFVFIVIACALTTGVVFWTFKKRKQEANGTEDGIEPQVANQEQRVTAVEEVAADKRETSKLSTVSALSTTSRRSFVHNNVSKAE